MEVKGYIILPVYELPKDSFTGFRQSMVEIGPHGISTTSGLGGDAVWAEIDESGDTAYYSVAGRDVLAGVMELTGHPDVDRVATTSAYNANALC